MRKHGKYLPGKIRNTDSPGHRMSETQHTAAALLFWCYFNQSEQQLSWLQTSDSGSEVSSFLQNSGVLKNSTFCSHFDSSMP